MKKSDVLNLIISYLEKSQSISDACRSGRTTESKFFEFRGESPQLSSFRVETVSLRASRIVGIVFKKEEKIAYSEFMKLPKRVRDILLIHPIASKSHNPETKKPFNHVDCASLLGVSFEGYQTIRKKALECLVIRVKKTISSGYKHL